MREFLIQNCAGLIWMICAIEVVFALLLYKQYKESKSTMVACMLFIDAGLFLDALFIVLGAFVEGGLPEIVSRLRFITHGLLIPLMFPICGYGLKWKDSLMKGVWIFTAMMMVAGLAQALAIDLELKVVGSVLRHVSADTSPAWAEMISSILSFGSVIPLMIVGIVVWVKQKTPHLFLSGFLMFVFSALGPATGNFDLIFFISMFGEVLMTLFFYLYAKVCLNQK